MPDLLKKITPEAADFRQQQGIEGHRCGECEFFVGADCVKVDIQPDPFDVCKEFGPLLSTGRISMLEGSPYLHRSASGFEMFISRVSRDPQTGQRRWYATASGVERDAFQERMSLDLFKDFIRRIEAGDQAPAPFRSKAWKGGLPYLGISHYLDLDGFGIAGQTERLWVDGQVLKAMGTFTDNEIGRASYEAIERDTKDARPHDERTRISIAFLDWGHEHEGRGAFERRSLLERCEMCVGDSTDKIYRKGQLVHLALTRRPAYVRTEISLEEKSMATKQEDAASIVGEPLAEKLEGKTNGVIERAVAAGAVVIRKEGEAAEVTPAPPVTSGTVTLPAVVPALEAKPALEELSLGGAKSFDEVDAYLQRASPGALLDSYGILAAVMTNIAGADKKDAVAKAVTDFQSKIDVLALKTLVEVKDLMTKSAAAVPVEVPAPEAPPEHVLDAPLLAFRDVYDEAKATPIAAEQRMAMLQNAWTDLAGVVRSNLVDQPTGATTGAATGAEMAEVVKAAVEAAVAPLRAEIAAMTQAKPVTRIETPPGIPPRRALRLPPSAGPAPVERTLETGVKPSGLRALVRKSVGLSK